MDRWRSWNAAKLPGRAVCRFVRGWVNSRLTIEVHRTACVVTHPPGGERANDALVNPANERLAGTFFSTDECWKHLYGVDPTMGMGTPLWSQTLGSSNEKFRMYPSQSIDGLVTQFGGPGLREALEALHADADGVRCPTGSAVLTRSYGDLQEMFGTIVHAVAPFYRRPTSDRDVPVLAEVWEAQTVSAYRSAFDAAVREGLVSIAVPLLGAGMFIHTSMHISCVDVCAHTYIHNSYV